jgi:hypothetical protein
MLITAKEVIEISFTGEENIKENRIPDSVIESAQEKYLRPVLTGLHDHLTKPAYTQFVNDYIKPPLAFFVRYLVLPSMSIQLSNMGAFLPETDFSKTATDRQRDTLRQSALSIAEPLLEKAVRYIEENRSGFPEYVKKSRTVNKVKGGIVF